MLGLLVVPKDFPGPNHNPADSKFQWAAGRGGRKCLSKLTLWMPCQHTEVCTPLSQTLNSGPRSHTGRPTFPKVNIPKENKWVLSMLWGRGMESSRVIQEWKLQGFYMRNRSAHLTLCFGTFVSNWHSNFKTVHKTPFNYLALYRFYITLEVTDSIHFPSNYKTD